MREEFSDCAATVQSLATNNDQGFERRTGNDTQIVYAVREVNDEVFESVQQKDETLKMTKT